MDRMTSNFAERYWVIGGRWVDDARHLPWPRVLGPYGDYQAAQASAEDLNASGEPQVRYLVVADAPAPPDRP
ncbi:MULTISPECIES: hypothetical protein [Caulobacter]|jgi:hypothetical protein|uniref:SPOR domain-containing protein n=1 Tax=Caulobacter vibrioides OR37 TaxID=1292034 RepID=R0E5Y3_CAUVI|nr:MULTISPECIES: hypothetical protein [Caulobacter]ENZ80978.1 hypothetical protein OR37_03104 [Caulobacter vibrioides OR37]MBQ1559361.1 hypothetical protein [Caulobacter sp.]